jgi:hypothetical protein
MVREYRGSGDLLLGLWMWCRAEQLRARWKGGRPFTIGQEAKVTDAHETVWEHVQPQKSLGVEQLRHSFILLTEFGAESRK